MYALVHGLLVRATPAYRGLVREIEATVRGEMAGPGAAAAVPCSTGEWLAPIADLGAPWTLIDVDPGVLGRAARALGSPVRIVADLSLRLPIAPESQDLLLCVHALHVLPDQQAQLARFAVALRRGGVLVLVAFGVDEGVLGFAARVARGSGGWTMLSMLPWKLLDRLWTRRASYASATDIASTLRALGLDVVSCRPVFAGTSSITVARRPAPVAEGQVT